MKKNYTLYTCLLIFIAAAVLSCSTGGESNAVSDVGNTGKGGSTARFTIVNNYLYTIDDRNLNVFDISTNKPTLLANAPIGLNIETIFALGNNLLIGAATGMYVYDISQPTHPTQVALYSHFTRCDPVVANDSVAFVTLRSFNGRTCSLPATWGANNVLEVVNIRDRSDPRLIAQYPMNNPYGMGIDDKLLFVCDAGLLRVMNISKPYAPLPQISTLAINLNDVIPLGTHLIGVGDNAVYDIDYTDPTNLRILSQIKRNSNELIRNTDVPIAIKGQKPIVFHN